MNTSGTNTAYVVQGSSTVTAKSSGTSGTVLKRSGFEEPAENMVGTIAIAASSATVTGTNTQFGIQLTPGDMLTFTDAGGTSLRRKVLSIASKTSLTLTSTTTARKKEKKWKP